MKKKFYLLKKFCVLALLISCRTAFSQTASALNFDGVNDDVSLGAITPSNSSYTKEAWIYANAYSTCNIISSSSAPFWLTSGQLSALHSPGGTTIQDPATFPLNQWVHVAVTYDAASGNMNLYKNGVLVASGTQATHAGDFITLGQYAGANRFQGSMDEVRIWNTVRKPCEINTYMNCEIPASSTGLLANYHFNQGIAGSNNSTITTLTDYSGNSNTGTLNNFALTGTLSTWISPSAVVNGYTTTLAAPIIAVNSGTMASGGSFTMIPSGGVSYTYFPNGPVVSPTSVSSYTVIGTASTGCTNTAISTISVQAGTFNFNGFNSKVFFGIGMNSVLNPLNKITVEAWVNTSTTSGLGHVVGNYNNSLNQMQFLLRRDLDQYVFWVDDGTGYKSVGSGTSSVLINTWQHVAGVWDGTKLLIYINGVLKGTTTGVNGSNFASTSNAMTIGSNGGNEGFKGNIDEVRIWTRPLCNAEILNNMNGEIPTTELGLLANYHFNQGFNGVSNSTVSIVYDASGHNYNGSLTNVSLSGTSTNWVAPGAFANGVIAPTFVRPTISVTGSNTVCLGSSTTFTANGNVSSYAWSSGDGTAIISVSPSVNTTYSVVGTNTLGCQSNIATQTITVKALPTISVNSGSVCAGSSYTINAYGALTYSYSSGTSVVSPTSNATYSVTGTNIFGCTSNTYAVCDVFINPLPTVTVNSGTICSGQSFTLIPDGAFLYVYSSYNDVVYPTTNTTYSVGGYDLNGCLSAVDAIANVYVNNTPTISVNSEAICIGNSYTITPTGAITYTYSSNSAITTPTITETYTVMGTDANGCEGSAFSTVTVNDLPTVTMNGGAICSGNSFTLDVGGSADSFVFSSGSNIVSPTANESYTVIGTDGNGCQNTAVASVSVNALPTIIAITSNTLLCTGQTASLSAIGASTYTWNTSETTAIIAINPISTTVYTVTGTDANGCNNMISISQNVSTCTDINTLTEAIEGGVNVYPNPTNGILNVDLGTTTENGKVELLNALGQVLLTETTNIQHVSFNMNHLADGIYFLRANVNNSSKTIRIIKN